MHDAFIANELKARLLEHAPNPILPMKRLDVSNTNIPAQYLEDKFDCVIASLISFSEKDMFSFFQEIYQRLAVNGFFLFSTLGNEHPYALEVLGDTLLKVGFQCPVVDREKLQLRYDDKRMLLEDLENSGLTEQSVRVTNTSSGDMIASFDVMYAYALKTAITHSSLGTIEIPLETIKLRR